MPTRFRESIRQNRPLFISTALASLAFYAFHFIASRRLGVDDYGAIATLLSAVTLLNAIAAIGATIVARFAAEFHALEDHARLRRLLDIVTQISAVLFAAAVLSALALATPLSAFLQIGSRPNIVLTSLLAGCTVAVVLLRALFQGMQRFAAFSISFIIEQAGRAIIATLIVVGGFRVQGALLGSIAATAFATMYTYLGLRRSLSQPPTRLRLDYRRLVIASSAIAISTLCLATLSFFDVILAKHYLSPHDAGLYSFAILPGRALTTVAAFLPTWMLPTSAQRFAKGISGNRMLAVTLGVAGALGALALAIFYTLSNAIVSIVAGQAFAGAATLIFPYGCAAALFSLTSIVVAYQIGQHRFTFVIPLLFAVLCEVSAIALFHETPLAIVQVVLGANALALLASLIGITGARRESIQVGDKASIT